MIVRRMLKKFPGLAFISGIIVLLFVIASLLAPWIANDPSENWALVKFGPETVDLFNTTILAPPDSMHWLGTDYVGRDILARLVHGVRNSLLFSFIVVLACVISGVVVGGIM